MSALDEGKLRKRTTVEIHRHFHLSDLHRPRPYAHTSKITADLCKVLQRYIPQYLITYIRQNTYKFKNTCKNVKYTYTYSTKALK